MGLRIPIILSIIFGFISYTPPPLTPPFEPPDVWRDVKGLGFRVFRVGGLGSGALG